MSYRHTNILSIFFDKNLILSSVIDNIALSKHLRNVYRKRQRKY